MMSTSQTATVTMANGNGKSVIRPPRPSSMSSIPQFQVPIATKTNVILKNNQQQPTLQQQQQQQQKQQQPPSILDKIKLLKSQPNASSNDSNSRQVTNPKRTSIIGSVKSDSMASLNADNQQQPQHQVNNNRIIKVTKSVAKIVNGNSNIVINGIKRNDQTPSLSSDNNRLSSLTGNRLIKRIPPPRNCSLSLSRPPTTAAIDPIVVSQAPLSMTPTTGQSNLIPPAMVHKPTSAVRATCKTDDNVGQRLPMMIRRPDTGHDDKSMIKPGSCLPTPTGSGIRQSPAPSIALVAPMMMVNRRQSREEIVDVKKMNEERQTTSEVPSNNTGDQPNSVQSKSQATNQTAAPTIDESSDCQPDSNGQQDSASSHGEESAGNSDVDTALVNIKPMEPITRSGQQLAYLRSTSSPNRTPINVRFPNNYSTIETDYFSDCTSNRRPTNNHPNQQFNQQIAGRLPPSGAGERQLNCRQQQTAVVGQPIVNCANCSNGQHNCPNHRHHHHHHQHYHHHYRQRQADSGGFTHFRSPVQPSKETSRDQNSFRKFCLDDSSSLSSDPGMNTDISSTDITTTSSSSGHASHGSHNSGHDGDARLYSTRVLKSGLQKSSSSSSSSSSRSRSSAKKTDSSMQTESVSAISTAAALKKYLHDRHVMMKVNNSVAPRNGHVLVDVDESSDGTKSLDRLNGLLAKKPKENGDLKNRKQELVMLTKRPLSSPNSSRLNMTTIPGPKPSGHHHRHHHKRQPPVGAAAAVDQTQSDSEFVQKKALQGKYLMLSSPRRDPTEGRMSYDSSDGQYMPMSPWLHRHAVNLHNLQQRNALTEAESLESLTGPETGQGNGLFSGRRPSSASIRLRDSSSPAHLAKSPNPMNLNNLNNLNRPGRHQQPEASSQPTSPTRLFASQSMAAGGGQTRPAGQHKSLSKDEDEVHGSSLSLVSSVSIFSSAEDKYVHEIRKLRRELDQSNEKVTTLSSQLTTNAHMIAAFEQSLSSMTQRLHQLTAAADQKDQELERLRATIEQLKRPAIADGNQTTPEILSNSDKQHQQPVKTAQLVRRHTFNTTNNNDQNAYGSRQLNRELELSTESVSSGSSSDVHSKNIAKKKDKPVNHNHSGWLRSSFSRAFKKSPKPKKPLDDTFDKSIDSSGGGSAPNSPLLSRYRRNDILDQEDPDDDDNETVRELRRQLREKEMILTDIRLESLSSAHQLDTLKETVNRMRVEMMSLKQDNDRLQRLVNQKSLGSSQSSMASNCANQIANGSVNSQEDRRHSIESLEVEAVTTALLCDGGKRAIVGCGSHAVACLAVTPKTRWEQLDVMVKKCFKDHLARLDAGSLGLSLDSLACYQVGTERIERPIISGSPINGQSPTGRPVPTPLPELLPYGYLVNDSRIQLQFKSASDSLVFDTLTPKPVANRMISMLTEHRRLVLAGPSGTGKTFLAQKLAEFLSIQRLADRQMFGENEDCQGGSIVTFNVDHKSAKELRAYLSNLAELASGESPSSRQLPAVIILDNLHHIDSMAIVFNGLDLSSPRFPYIIGTLNHNTCSASHQLPASFKWLLCANHLEPVRGLLSRYLRRKVVEFEVRTASINSVGSPTNHRAGIQELSKVIDWIPKVWQQINKFLEAHASTDATIGPRLFLSCPMDAGACQVWFTDLWNYSIVPYLVEAARDGIQTNGVRSAFQDPTDWLIETYPWQASDKIQELIRIRPDDVGHFTGDQRNQMKNGDVDASDDPLLNMLMRLQEAANFSSHPKESSANSQQQQQPQCC